MIRYYLGEEPILGNVPTYLARDADDRAYILENLDELVVKAVERVGRLRHADRARSRRRERARASSARKIEADPRNYIAQPTIALSPPPDLRRRRAARLPRRPAALHPLRRDAIRVVPGGLTRVALRAGSLVVNSSQGGGSKDTWVLLGPDASRVAESLYWMPLHRARRGRRRACSTSTSTRCSTARSPTAGALAAARRGARRRGAPTSSTTRRPRRRT